MTDSPKRGARIVFIAIAVIFALYIYAFEKDALFSSFKLDIESSGIQEELENIQGAFDNISSPEEVLTETLFGAGDFDNDGLDNRLELLLGSNTAVQDSDEDGIGDYEEFLNRTDLISPENEESISPQVIEKRVIALSEQGIEMPEQLAVLYYRELALVETENDNEEDARFLLNLAYQYNPTEDFFTSALQQAHQADNKNFAVLIAENFISEYPETSDAFFHLGFAYQEQGQTDLALEQYLRAESLGSQLPALYNNIGILAQKRGEIELAKTYYDQAIEQSPENTVYRQNRALLDN